MKPQVTLELDATCTAVLRAATHLLSDSRIRFVPRLRWDTQRPPHGNTLRLEPGSRAYPALTLLWGEDKLLDATGLAPHVALGSTSAIWWDGRRLDTWRDTGRPLPRRALWGKPDSERPWVLIAPHTNPVAQPELESLTGVSRPQPHLLLPNQRAWDDAVWWAARRSTLRSLLGHVDVLVAAQGPLAWDAARLGVRAVSPRGALDPAGLVARRLARVVPPALARDRRFWQGIVSRLVRGEATDDWNTLAWVRLARELSATSYEARLRRWAGQLVRRLRSR